MPYDSDGNYYDDTNTDDGASSDQGGGSYTDNSTPTTSYHDPVYSSDATVTTNADGSQTITNGQGTATTIPKGATVDSTTGNIISAAGKIIGAVAPGLLASALSPYLSNLQSGGYLASTAKTLSNVGNNIRAVSQPNLAALIPQLQQQVAAGTLTAAQAQAALAQASQQAPSELNNVQTDAQSLAAQRAALARLADVGTNGGMTEADRAQLASTIDQTNAAAAQQRQAQIQQLQMQGNAGTGAELAARLAGSQGLANANAEAGANVAQSAQSRALAAIQANLQGNAALNSQQFGEAATKAQAQDVVNQFNTQAQNTIAQQNAAAQTQAALQNAQQTNAANTTAFNAKQAVNANNTAIANQNLLMPLQVGQQQYANAVGQQTAASTADVGAGKSLADLINPQVARANTTASGATTAAAAPASSGSSGGGTNWGQIIGAVGSIASLFSDEKLKTDKEEMSDEDVDNMMGRMTANQYRYKGPKSNPMQMGVMAQDVEKGMPNSVIDTPAGKMIQKPEMMSNVLAILANNNERIRRLEGNK